MSLVRRLASLWGPTWALGGLVLTTWLLLVACTDDVTTTRRIIPFDQDPFQSSNVYMSLPLHGKVTGEDGRPAAGIEVTLYPVNGVYMSLPYRVQAAWPKVVTDDAGMFAFPNPPTGICNLEAVKSDSFKAFMAEVEVKSGSSVDAGTLRLARTGTIVGKVRVGSATVTDLHGVAAYVPGTSYRADTDAAGDFTIPYVSAGRFTLLAEKESLGDATASITVPEGGTVTVPPLDLVLRPPVITGILPGHGGRGATVSISGRFFGATLGIVPVIEFKGLRATSVTPVSDQRVDVTVPDDADTGDVSMTRGTLLSNSLRFQVLAALLPSTDLSDMLAGAQLSLSFEAQDTTGARIPEPMGLSFSTTGGAIALQDVATRSVVVRALQAGDATVSVRSGTCRWSRVMHVVRVDGVQILPATMSLNAPPATGVAHPSFVTSGTMAATVLSSDGRPRGVTWSTLDPGRLQVDGAGRVTVRPGAAAGWATVKATSVLDPRVSGTASVLVTDIGGVQVEIE